METKSAVLENIFFRRDVLPDCLRPITARAGKVFIALFIDTDN